MNYILSYIYSFLKKCINSPLSLLRFILPLFFGKKVYENLDYNFYLENAATNYSLSKTWILELLPNSIFTLNYNEFIILKSILLMSTICAIIGLLGRLNLLFLSITGFIIFGMVEGYGIFDHHMSLPNQIIFVMALVPGTMKISIDNWLLCFFKKQNINNQPRKWGLQLILLLLAMTYFTAGVSKLRYGDGIKWLDGSTLSFYLMERSEKYKNGSVQILIGDKKIKTENKWKDEFGFIAHTYGNYQTSKKWNNIAEYIADNKILIILLSIGSLLFELSAFFLFFNSKYRNVYLLSAILFHISIGQLMGISFRQYQLICFCLIDWNLIFKYLKNYLIRFNFIKKIDTYLSLK